MTETSQSMRGPNAGKHGSNELRLATCFLRLILRNIKSSWRTYLFADLPADGCGFSRICPDFKQLWFAHDPGKSLKGPPFPESQFGARRDFPAQGELKNLGFADAPG